MTKPEPWERPLWTCERCGKSFVTRNMYHSCTVVPLDSHFKDRPTALRLFETLRSAIEELGPVTVVPNKSGIAFMTRVRFGGVRVRKDYLLVSFWLKRRITSPRIVKYEEYGPHDFGYLFELREPDGIDLEVREWLREAWAVGRQDHLRSGRQS
jgi:hypothetical protein